MNKRFKSVTKFESLPNEILSKCFGYINACELFNSFDQLNYRFNHLIRNSRLYVDFSYIRYSIFDKFCKNIFENFQIKDQIYSLHISNKNSFGLIKKFLLLFSTVEFPHLRSLKLTIARNENIQNLKPILSSMKKLSSLHINASAWNVYNILLYLTILKLKTLSITSFSNFPLRLDVFLSVVNLTIIYCDLSILHDILTNSPQLNYLKVKELDSGDEYSREKFSVGNLTIIVIDNLNCNFDIFKDFLKRIPNLKYLTICTDWNETILNAYQWEYLITSSLSQLETFKFRFNCDFMRTDSEIVNIFQKFQSDFWLKTHHWYTECLLTKSSKWICTISCPLYQCDICSFIDTSGYNFSPIDSNDIPNFVSKEKVIQKKHEFYFYEINSLEFLGRGILNQYCLNTFKDIFNLSGVHYLKISWDCKITNSSVLIKIIKELPKLSSISIDQTVLIPLLDDDELSEYLNKIIKLNLFTIRGIPLQAFNNYIELRRFCKIFSNVEILKCSISRRIDFKFLINNLSKLINMKIFMKTYDNSQTVSYWIDKILENRYTNYNMNYIQTSSQAEVRINIWMG